MSAVPDTGTALMEGGPLLSLIQLNGEMFHVYPEYADRLQQQYPAVAVRQQFQEMQAWLEANPRNRKTEKGMARFVNNWLSRRQDRARPPVAASKSGGGVVTLGKGDLL